MLFQKSQCNAPNIILRNSVFILFLASSMVMGSDSGAQHSIKEHDAQIATARHSAFAALTEVDVERIRQQRKETPQHSEQRFRKLNRELEESTALTTQLEEALLEARIEIGVNKREASMAREFAVQSVREARDQLEKTETELRLVLQQLAAAKANAEINERLANESRAQARDDAQRIGACEERLRAAQQLLNTVVTSDRPGETLAAARQTIMRSYQADAASLSAGLDTARTTLSQAEREHKELLARRGTDNQPDNLEALIELVANKITRLQEEVSNKERSLVVLNGEKDLLQRQIDGIPKKYVRGIIEELTKRTLDGMSQEHQMFELIRLSNNYESNLADRLAAGKPSLRLEIVELIGSEQLAKELFKRGGIADAVTNLFFSDAFTNIVGTYSKGMNTGGKDAVLRNFRDMIQNLGIKLSISAK